MNVLVYSGPGSSSEATKQALTALRQFVSPYYAVTTVTDSQILHEPWEECTSLLVIPGGADLPYCKQLNGKGNDRIKKYVRQGGNFWGLCAGAYYGSAFCEFGKGTPLEVSGPRELAFYSGIARGPVYNGFEYGTNKGTRAASVITPDGEKFKSFFNGGCAFIGKDPKAEVLLRYVDKPECESEDPEPPAVLHVPFGKGHVILAGVHPEYSMDTLVAHDLRSDIREDLIASNDARMNFFRTLLAKCNLRYNTDASAPPTKTPLLFTCMDKHLLPTVSSTMKRLSQDIVDSKLEDSHDTFLFCEPRSLANRADDKSITMVGVYDDATTPPAISTPYFNLHLYYTRLQEQEKHLHVTPSGIGRAVMYAEIVTSTSTLIDRNPKMLRLLPHGLVVLGTQQTQGRGRGGNVWVNPVGVLPVSGILRVPQAELRQSLVFVQYLISMAIVDALHSFGPEYKKLGVRLKWPNDIYIEKDDSYVKIGGVLVTLNILDGTFVLAFGAGTNVCNLAPSTSINTSIDNYNAKHGKKLQPVSQEELLARMLARLDEMWVVFLDLGFAPFEQHYYELWLHSDKVVRLDQYNNAKAMVKGITLDTGMMIVQEVNDLGNPTGNTWELQPDGNSFDMLKGLIKKKE